MNNSAVANFVGATPATLTEQILSTVQASLVVSRRTRVAANDWKLDLQSPFWRLYYHAQDGVRVVTAGGTTYLRARRLYLIPAWLHFAATTQRDILQDYQHFNITGIPLTLTRYVFRQPIKIAPGEPGMATMIRQWRSGITKTGNAGLEQQFKALALIQLAMAAAIRGLPDANRGRLEAWLRSSHPITAALQLIERDLARQPSNTELARAVGQSADHFSRRFKAAVGMTPARYGVERRIALATHRLLMTDDRIEVIAADYGFADRFHFSRAFRSVVGMPPARFRVAHR